MPLMSVFSSVTSRIRNLKTASGEAGEGPGHSVNAEKTEMTPPSELGEVSDVWEKLQTVSKRLSQVIRGKDDVIEMVLTALLAEGSILLEDVPGVGKTTLAKSIARLIDLNFHRVQCTPDLLPGDILGGSIYQPTRGEFEFRPGPIFCNLFLADEINRASPRTQSALLEAMAEAQVTIDSKQYDLKHPFMVIATQNPIGFEGTYPLPESQLDRFLIRSTIEYPDVENEIGLLLDQTQREPSDELTAIMSASDLVTLQKKVRAVIVDRKVAEYVVALAGATRQHPKLRVGCSPRGSKMLLRAAQAHAILRGRDFVLPDDVQRLTASVMAHRMSLRRVGGSISEIAEIVGEIVKKTEVPV
jgi:MoxR-like ATPase